MIWKLAKKKVLSKHNRVYSEEKAEGFSNDHQVKEELLQTQMVGPISMFPFQIE